MKTKEPRFYRLWFVTSGMWCITFLGNLSAGREPTWLLVVQFLNILVSLGAGVVNARRYKKRQEQETNE